MANGVRAVIAYRLSQADDALKGVGGLDAELAGELEELERRGLLRRRVPWGGGAPAPRLRAPDGRWLLSLAGNDYLGLASHPEVRAAAAAALEGAAGSGGSPLICGYGEEAAALERELTAWKGAEAALLFPSGYQANVSLLPALAGPGDAVFLDRLCHASLVDGARLSRATLYVYKHADAEHLEALLRRRRGRHRRALVVTDGVFSMDGDLAPLPALAEACERHGVWLVVDDAHGTGVLGPDGSGTAAHQGVKGRIPVQMGTLSKALGAQGGFVAGSRPLVEHLVNRARGYVFSTGLAPSLAAAARAAAAVARREAWRRERVLALAARLRAALRDLGYRVPEGETPIIPVLVGEAAGAVALAAALREQGVYAPAVRPPTVPAGTARLRVSVSAVHSDADLEEAVASFGRARDAAAAR